MRRIKLKTGLPKWFNLKNYESFCSMNDADLFYQLSARWDTYAFSALVELVEIESIISTGVIADAQVKSELLHRDLEGSNAAFGMLAKSGGVEPLSMNEHYRIHTNVEEHARENGLSVTSRFIDKFLFHPKSVNSFIDEEYENNMYLKVDLSWPDDLIIKDMIKLLPLWREELNAKPEIDHNGYGWESVKKKMLDYSLFPLIDLLIWECKTNSKITNGVLAVSVYPQGDYDATNITQTIKPNLEKIFNFYSIEKCRRELLDRKLLPLKKVDEKL